MANNFIKFYINQGIEEYQGEYDYNSVISYLTACILNSNLITSSQLSLVLNYTIRTAQRYLSNNQRQGFRMNINDTVLILNLVNYTTQQLFTDADNFIKGKYLAANYVNNVCKFYTSDEFCNSNWDKSSIALIVKALRKLSQDSSPCDEIKRELLIELNSFPKSLVELVTYQTSNEIQKLSYKIHKAISNEVA